MPRGIELSEVEVRKVYLLHGRGHSERQIAKLLHRSKTAVHNVLSKQDSYGTAKRTGRKKSLSARAERQIRSLATSEQMSTREIARTLDQPVSHVTVWKRLTDNPAVRLLKMKAKPKLTEMHKTARLEWAQKYMSWTHQWRTVLFSDEKKFNLDGPDGCHTYWHDLRKEPKVTFSRQSGGGGVMVWGAFAFGGKADLVRVTTRLNSAAYQQLLYDHMIPFGPFLGGPEWHFQQDNAPCHAANSTRAWFQQEGIQVLDWPSRSPDLNPMENVWGMLARRVYSRNRQFHHVNDLEVVIMHEWDKLKNTMLETLVDSMPTRVYALIKQNGKPIDY